MRGITKTAAAVAAAVTMGAGAAYAVPAVSNVQMTQRAGTRVVDITYDLAGEAAIVTLGIETNGVAIPDSAVTRLSGDVSVVVQPGTNRHIVWNAGADWPEHAVTNARARVTAWSTNAPPLYCAVDVTGGPSTNSYPVYYYVSAEGVPGGVTNYAYKTNLILMRRIDSTGGEGFWMGSPSNETGRNAARETQVRTWLAKGYYVGVYQVTQSQWQQVMGDVLSWPAKWSNNDYRLTRPVEQVSYNDIRGSSAGAGWPADDNVDENTFIWRLRTKTGLAGFDLPTEAQWEYAARAGTGTAFSDGSTDYRSDAVMALSWYRDNASATHEVGLCPPNAWGLYDVHGNVAEWCLDWMSYDITSYTIEPGGPETTPPDVQYVTGCRVVRGGSYGEQVIKARSARRGWDTPNKVSGLYGARLCLPLPFK